LNTRFSLPVVLLSVLVLTHGSFTSAGEAPKTGVAVAIPAAALARMTGTTFHRNRHRPTNVTAATAAANGSTRWAMLRTVSAGPQMTWPGMVGLSVEAPTMPAGMPSSSITSEMMPEQSPSARKRSTAPDGGFGVDCIRMRSAAMRPVSFLSTMTMFLNRAAFSHCGRRPQTGPSPLSEQQIS
jgi:hypothetical protein